MKTQSLLKMSCVYRTDTQRTHAHTHTHAESTDVSGSNTQWKTTEATTIALKFNMARVGCYDVFCRCLCVCHSTECVYGANSFCVYVMHYDKHIDAIVAIDLRLVSDSLADDGSGRREGRGTCFFLSETENVCMYL